MVAGLPEKAANTTKPVRSPAAEPLAPSIEQTPLWHGEKLSGEFRRDGAVIFQGLFGERNGTWIQSGERVEIELPSISSQTARVLGVGIIRGDRMAVRFKTIGVLGLGSTVSAIMRIAH